jgi:RNA polymerase sigma-70 factor (ECF subfamily)
MVGSVDEAEDLVQETYLRAWRSRTTFEGRASARAWLYRIATNVCIEALRRHRARSGGDDADGRPRYAAVPWLQPYPDLLLDVVADEEPPDAVVVEREAIELAFLATILLLPPKQRAALVLRDVLGFSAAETATVLDDTVPAVNSALQRARATVRQRVDRTGEAGAEPGHREPTAAEALLLQLFVDAQERADADAMVELLRDDVRMTLLPDGASWDGRADVGCAIRDRLGAEGDLRCVAIRANRQPAVAVYVRHPGEAAHRAWAVVVLGVRDGKIREIATFATPELFSRFDLPPTMD